MARASSQDPIDKFRFIVHVFDSIPVGSTKTQPSTFSVGFSEVTLPKITVGVINYKENNQTSFIKKPGLGRFDDVILRKGTTADTAFYDWMVKVFDPAANLNMWLNALSSQSFFSIAAVQNNFLRKDMIVTALDRTGSFAKSWFIYDCFPSGFKPGDFSASDETKVIEELTITCEGFIEVTGNNLSEILENVNKASQIALADAARAATIGAAAGLADSALSSLAKFGGR
jgi:phage tail-like protein